MPELKPCPFCGCSDVEFSVESIDNSDKVKVRVNCIGCPAEMLQIAFNDDGNYGVRSIKEDLSEEWNRRVVCQKN